jgi:hypothetical protein
MDLNQRKLNKSEWETIELPVSKEEIEILKLIIDGYQNVNIKYNKFNSLFSYLKIDYTEVMEDYLFNKYFSEIFKKMLKKYNIDTFSINVNANPVLKKADLIRIQKNDVSTLDKGNVYEYLLIDQIENLFKQKSKKSQKWILHYFTLYKLTKNNVIKINRHIINIINIIIEKLEEENINNFIIENAYEYIEKNENLMKYSDITLYDHQKEIFSICKDNNPKLILYITPTGTGKTITPIGLSERYKIIFVCAARHVGLALAKAAISVNKKIAFAFGCNTADDIRLHYFAAKDYTKNFKTGGIWKVDNSNGCKVEIIICDIKSYLPAMYYMRSFHPLEELMTYWDEPTITMDYENHDFHEIIKNNWKENTIHTMVLSSATLPKIHELSETIADFKMKFPGAQIHNIVSHDCKKSIPIIDNKGYVVLPHYLSDNYEKILEIVDHCENYLTLLRYLDLSEIVKFIYYVHKMKFVSSKVKMERYFETLDEINMTKIKLYYLTVLKNINKENWNTIYKELTNIREKRITCNNSVDVKGNKLKKVSSIGPGVTSNNNDKYEAVPISRMISEQFVRNFNMEQPVVKTVEESNCAIYVTTKDAYTLTDGPTIFLSNDVEKIAKFCIQQANIPEKEMENIMDKITFNNKLNAKIEQLEKDLEDENDNYKPKEDDNTKKTKDNHKMNRDLDNNNNNVVKDLVFQINNLKNMIKVATLNDVFVPNTLSHINKWADDVKTTNSFKCDIGEDIITKIMLLNGIEDSWKILLLMGIGVFTNHNNITYTEIMKSLSDQQKLYMIIASTDYIYGLNYQYCHGYLSKDLNFTQEKIIQSIGRIGRSNIQQDYTIRLRCDSQISKLFTLELNKPEVINMNKLFNSS